MNQESVPVWGIHTGRPRGQSKAVHQVLEDPTDRLFKDGYIAIGWPQLGDLSEQIADREVFRKGIAAHYGVNASPQTIGADAGTLFRFVHEMQVGDLVVYRSRVDKLIYIGRVTGPYFHDPSKSVEYPHLRGVDWLGAFRREEFTDQALRAFKARRSLFQIRSGVGEFRTVIRVPST